MINCIIIDDEQPAINIIINYLRQVAGIHLVATTTSPVEGLKIIDSQPIDLVFLDIQMPEITGTEFIRAMNRKCKIIIISAHSEFAIEGFELEVIDYLLKPVPLARFLKAINKAMAALKDNETRQASRQKEYEFIMVKGNAKGKLIKVEIDDVDYIEGSGNYVTIHCKEKKILSMVSLKDLEDKLPINKFIRVHKSFIVAVSQISMVNGNDMVLKNHPQTEILIGKLYKPNLLETLRSRSV